MNEIGFLGDVSRVITANLIICLSMMIQAVGTQHAASNASEKVLVQLIFKGSLYLGC